MPTRVSARLALLSALLFTVLATANAAGYRYGVSDQAFYIPAVVRALDPSAFPRDGVLIDAQAKLMVLDEILAAIARITGVPLPALFAAGYLLSLLLIWAGLLSIGNTIYSHHWATLALIAAYTLRHRITRTSANTFEGYFHPRMLAFGVCVLAVAALLRRRSWTAIALVALGGLIHPTTGLWFAVMIGVALMVCDRTLRPWLLGIAGLSALAAAWMIVAGPLNGSFVRIDPEWRQVLASKDSLFANEWPFAAWLANLGTAAVFLWAAIDRRRRHEETEVDAGLMAGGIALLVVFLVTLPFVAAGVSFFVELQISRVFWLIDLLATMYLVGALDLREQRRPLLAWAVAALVVCSVARGTYILWVENPGRRLVALTLEDSPWHDAMRWIAAQPIGIHVLADPGHAWKYGTSVRVSGQRDVLVEDVKDSAVAMYSRAAAMRLLERSRALGDFAQMTPAHARELAVRYDLDYLVTTASMDLPAAYRTGPFTIYQLRP